MPLSGQQLLGGCDVHLYKKRGELACQILSVMEQNLAALFAQAS